MAQVPLAELRRRYVEQGRPMEASVEALLRADPRPGAKAILTAIERRRFDNRSEGQRLRKLSRYESAIWATGVMRVAGVDEAGMSPLAGPVAAAAVIFAPSARIAGIDDSKKLLPHVRARLAGEIKDVAVAWCVAFVEVEEIDTINIYHAGLLAMRRAVDGLSCAPEHLLIDARRLKSCATPQQAIIRGDSKSASIAAASILAKTARDALMERLDRDHPDYGFAQHKGYPVGAHFKALKRFGACPIHRRSFAPVREILGLPPLPPWPKPAGEVPASN